MENTAEQWKDRAKRADSQEKNRRGHALGSWRLHSMGEV